MVPLPNRMISAMVPPSEWGDQRMYSFLGSEMNDGLTSCCKGEAVSFVSGRDAVGLVPFGTEANTGPDFQTFHGLTACDSEKGG